MNQTDGEGEEGEEELADDILIVEGDDEGMEEEAMDDDD